MTTNTDPKTPNTEDSQTVVVAQRQEATPAPIADDDPDAIMLREAQAQVEQEQGSKAEPEPEPTGTAASQEPPAQAGAQTETPATQGQPTPMVPKPRLDEALNKLDETNRKIAFLEGRLAQSQSQPTAQPAQGTATPAPAQPVKTITEQLDALDMERIALAEKYDKGELSTVEWKKAETELDKRSRALLLEQQKPAAAPQNPQGDDLFLDQVTDQLEQQHPYTVLITSDADWQFLEVKAREQLKAEGQTIGADSRSTFLLRQKMAQLTDTYGPAMTGKTIEKKAPPANAGQPNGGAAKPATQQPNAGVSQTAQARAAKLDLAARHPVNTGTVGGAAATGETVSAADIENMSDEEIAALPPQTRRRFLQT